MAWLIGVFWMLAACEPPGEVRVQELPPLTLPSPEERAGLPEVAGAWRFVGFTLPPVRDTLAPPPEPIAPGNFVITTQRLDSLAGVYVTEAGRVPFVGEIRRDSVISLVAFAADGARFAAGRVAGDTFWVDLTSFGVAETWPTGTRAAFSRRPPPPPPPVPTDTAARDTLVRDTLAPDSARVPAQPPVATPGTAVPGARTPVAPRPRTSVPAARPVPVTPPAPRPQVPVAPSPDTPVTPTPPDTMPG